MTAWMNAFRMLDGETLAGLLEMYQEVARRTDELVATLPTSTPGSRCPRRPGLSRARAGRHGGS